jgi:hypothetical protein
VISGDPSNASISMMGLLLTTMIEILAIRQAIACHSHYDESASHQHEQL